MVIVDVGRKKEGQGMRLGKYELGRTLGEGNFGKVKLARDIDSGQPFAVKILDKSKIIDLNNADQVLIQLLCVPSSPPINAFFLFLYFFFSLYLAISPCFGLCFKFQSFINI